MKWLLFDSDPMFSCDIKYVWPDKPDQDGGAGGKSQDQFESFVKSFRWIKMK